MKQRLNSRPVSQIYRGRVQKNIAFTHVGCVGKFPKRPPARAFARSLAPPVLLLALKVLSAGGRRPSYELRRKRQHRGETPFQWTEVLIPWATCGQTHRATLKEGSRPRLGCLPSSKLDETFFVKKF